jgi:hypothetical protein
MGELGICHMAIEAAIAPAAIRALPNFDNVSVQWKIRNEPTVVQFAGQNLGFDDSVGSLPCPVGSFCFESFVMGTIIS